MFHDFLDNGVEVILKENHFAKMVAVQCWVGVGSLAERGHEKGMAHVLEHMLFKGTTNRAVGEIAGTVEAAGGDINAYTTFDRTVYYLTLASHHAILGVELLADAIFNSTFDPEELAREKEVIVEEIKRSLDDPGALTGRRIFELAYAGSEAGRPIIGSEESVRSFSRENVVAFHDRWYRPRNLAVVVVGDFSTPAMLAEVKRRFGTAPDRPIERLSLAPRLFPKRVTASVLRGDFTQPRLELAFEGPTLESFDAPGLDLAAFALGSGETSRFNRTLRDREGVVTSVGASLYAPSFGGVFEVSALPSSETLLDALRGLARETMRLKYHEPVGREELARARANLKAERILQEETVEGQARALGFGLTTAHKYLFDDVYWTLINNMPGSSVEGAVQRWLNEERAAIVALVPQGTSLTEDELIQAFQAGVAEGRGQRPATRLARESALTAAPTEVPVKVQLCEGLTLVYRRNDDSKLFSLVAASEGGLRAESQKTAGTYNAFAGLLAKATRRRPYDGLMDFIEGSGAMLDGFSGKDSFGVRTQCLAEQAPAFINLVAECLLEPVFPEEPWLNLKREILDDLAAQDDSPANTTVRRFQEMIFGDYPYRYSLLGTPENVAAMSAEGLLDAFTHLRGEGPWVIGAVGPMPTETLVELLREAFARFKPKAQRRVLAASQPSRMVQPSSRAVHLAKDREQTHIVYGFRGLAWGDPERAALDVLTTVLGGQGGRLFLDLRDRDSLAYSVSPIVAYGEQPGIVGAYIACAPEKTERALSALRDEFARLRETAPSQTEVERSKNYLIGNHEGDMQRSEAQAMTMALMELYGVGHNDFLAYPKAIERVTAADVLKVSRRLLDTATAVTVTVGRED